MTYFRRWTRRGGSVLWPLRSPSVSPFDLFPMKQSQGMGVLRSDDYTRNLVARLAVACTSVYISLLRREHAFLPRCA
ncbi:hypothetical protein TNCV_1882791 [Trichonephila clavipes]|nr:hypothetical protein TNCV_1882791 [Trichonephila clavipes]